MATVPGFCFRVKRSLPVGSGKGVSDIALVL